MWTVITVIVGAIIALTGAVIAVIACGERCCKNIEDLGE